MDRASTQADPELARLIREQFVLVTGDRWYHSRQKDDVGKFVARLDEQAQALRPGKNIQQGLYCFRADGHLLSHSNRNARINMESLQDALAEWGKLPAAERKPGAVKVEPEGRPDRRYHRHPPVGGLVVNVFVRVLDRNDDGYDVGKSSIPGGSLAARDRMWVTRREWQALIPDKPNMGDEISIPVALRHRILRYHLCDHTRGQAYPWLLKHIRTSDMHLSVAEITDTQVKMVLKGNALLASGSQADVTKAPKGFDVSFLGRIHMDRSTERITRFDFVAIGDHWGEGRYNRGARPGHSPLGVAYQLCPADEPGRNVPPLGATDLNAYLE